MQEKKWRVELSKSAFKHLKKLEEKSAQKILENLQELEGWENPCFHQDIRPLVGQLKGFYRLRVGNMRIIFELDRNNRRIGVHAIIHRGSAY
ncbi:type II toxin-antitoxin system RelE/ParE family toxin [Acidobacteriota bacterium]